MKAIGLTGGIASGKSTVCDILKEYGIPVVNADDLAHQAIRKGSLAYGQIVRKFGREILSAAGEIDRKQLGTIVFANPVLRQELEQMIHPVVIEEIRELIENGRASAVPLMVFEIPLLFESGMEITFDAVWVVSVLPGIQEERLKKRNQLSDSEISKRINAQLPLDIKEGKADRVINNNGGLAETREQVRQILSDLGVIKCGND